MATRSKRVPRPKKEECPKGFDSKFEADLFLGRRQDGTGWHGEDNPQGLLKNWGAHPEIKIPYTIPKNYNTDFIKEIAGRTILLESKGRFWDADEYSKYRHCRDHLPPNYEIVFLFMNPKAPMPRARVRKCGTKLSHAEWADKNGFRGYTKDTLPAAMW